MLATPARLAVAFPGEGVADGVVHTLTPVLAVRPEAVVRAGLVARRPAVVLLALALVGLHALAVDAGLGALGYAAVAALDVAVAALLHRPRLRQSLGRVLSLELDLVLGAAGRQVQAPRVHLLLHGDLLGDADRLVVRCLAGADVGALQGAVGGHRQQRQQQHGRRHPLHGGLQGWPGPGGLSPVLAGRRVASAAPQSHEERGGRRHRQQTTLADDAPSAEAGQTAIIPSLERGGA